jgi:hypothetical protein
VSSPLRPSSSSRLDLIHHRSPSVTGPQIILTTFRSKTRREFSSAADMVRVSTP